MVRFGRRNKNRSGLGRRAKATARAGLSSVASEERSALLSGEADEEVTPAGNPRPANPSSSGLDPADPTQRLLTVLGRFQTHVVKAQNGAPQAAWSDECMNQLIAAVEIALAHGWTSLVKALTETGRILQTYEDAQDAGDCVTFLAESYDILCLMVGDLIVGGIRPGVLQKWEALYDRALDEVQTAGLTLVQDGEERVASVQAATDIADSEFDAEKPEPVSPFDMPTAEAVAADDAEDSLPTLDDLPPLADEAAAVGETPAAAAGLEESEAVVEFESVSPYSDEEHGEPQPVSEESPLEELPPLGDLPDSIGSSSEEEGAALEDALHAAPGEDASSGAFVVVEPESTRQVTEMLDALCDKLAQLKQCAEPDRQAILEAIQEDLATLKAAAHEAGRPGAEWLCQTMRFACLWAFDRQGELEDTFFDLAYAFGGIYAEAGDRLDDPAVEHWCAEAETLVSATEEEQVLLDAEPATPPEAEPAVPPEADSPQTLLENAQRLMDEGKAADAKFLALQAAANIAKLEAEKVNANVEETERQVRASSEAIDQARATVEQVEQEVAEAEAGISTSRSQLEAIRAQGQEIAASIEETEAGIAELDDQIAALQEERDAKSEALRQTQVELEAHRVQESKTQAELDANTQEEEAARTRLEDARQNVKNLQRRRSEIEAALTRARDELARQRTSLGDIEQTIAQLRSDAAEGASGEDAFLF